MFTPERSRAKAAEFAEPAKTIREPFDAARSAAGEEPRVMQDETILRYAIARWENEGGATTPSSTATEAPAQ